MLPHILTKRQDEDSPQHGDDIAAHTHTLVMEGNGTPKLKSLVATPAKYWCWEEMGKIARMLSTVTYGKYSSINHIYYQKKESSLDWAVAVDCGDISEEGEANW